MRARLFTFIVLDENKHKLYELEDTPERALMKLQIALVGRDYRGRKQ